MAASRFSSAGTSTVALIAILAGASLVAAGAPRVAGDVPQAVVKSIPPGRFVGHQVGADRKLVRWPRIVEYFEMLARTSDRVRVVELGRTTGGNRLIAAIVSSPSNLAAADELRRVASRLRAARGVDEVQARELAEKGKAIVAITLNLHSTEIASSQMALELGYHLATDQSAETRQMLAETVLLLIPSLNPDGQMMVCDWYAQGLGTPLEGGRLPWLYHQYAGHDNNRDWFMLNLVETRLVTRFIYNEWPVQALHDQHQMGARGARMFVPPYFDPINPNVHPLVWREIAVAGSDMAERLEEHKYAGVVSHATYDGWRPGDMDTTPWWHNVPALITEAASVRVATPIEQKLDDLTGEQRGLPTYTAQTNFPNPWRGGSWRLRDIVDYEFTAALGFLQSCARHKTDLLMNSWRMNRDAIERGSHEAPYAFVIPSNQDLWTVGKLLEPLLLAGVEVQRATGVFAADGASYPAGSYIVLMAQPLRPYAKDLLEAQRYPDRRVSPGGPPEVPYDEAGWTLPYKMGLKVVGVQEPFTTTFERLTALHLPSSRVVNVAGAAAFGLSAESNAATIVVNRVLRAGGNVTWSDEPVRAGDTLLPAHSYFVHSGPGADTLLERAMSGLPLVAHGVGQIPAGRPLRLPRVGLYQPWGGSADEGWTRWVFEQFELPYTTLHREDVREGGPLSARFDTIVLPSMRARELMTGEASSAGTPTLPAPYAGGLGPEGAERLATFVRSGGTLVAMDAASEFAISQLSLPVRNVLADRRAQEFFCPGSILQVEIQPGPFLTAGFGRTADIFFLHSPAFELTPGAAGSPRVLAGYGTGELLRSGWILGDRLLQQRAALVEVPVEKGRVILVGFRPQFRGQTYGTFRVLFNAAYESSAARGSSRP
ncbi:MAG: M14 metallopeptidase family protein [Bacteroidales bacterium]